MSHAKRPKVFVLGLDGADWSVIDHMIERGKMPTLASIKKNGAWGPLESTKPPITCPAWLTFGTGKNPGKLGVFFFLVRDGFKYSTVPFYFKRDVQGDNFWDLLSREGFRVGVVNIPTVHRPYAINGFIIAGFMSKSRKDWLDEGEGEPLTYPEDLERELTERIGKYHLSFPKTTSSKAHILTSEEEIDEYEEVATQRFRALEHLMENKDWDLIAVDIMATDRIGHSMAQLLSPSGGKYDSKQGVQLRERIEGFYSRIDSLVAGIRNAAGENAYLFIISDHGMGPQKGKFAVNDWLIKRGYLRLKRAKGKAVEKKGPSLKQRLYRGLSKVSRTLHLSKMIEILVRLLPKGLQGSVPYPLRVIDDSEIDWSRTRVFYRTKGHLFVNQKGREPKGIVEEDEKDRLLQQLIEELKEDASGHLGRDDILRMFRAEDIYSGKYRKYAPDIYFDFNGSYYHVDARIGHESPFESAEGSIRGNHRPHGIFMLEHEDIKRGRFEDLRLMDIAPTVLHIFDISIPDDMDGKVLRSIYREGCALSDRKVRKEDSSEKMRLSRTISKLKL